MKTSIVIATYNGGRFVIDQLESIRKQSIAPDEVIISDDGSSDDTVELVHGFIEDNNLQESWFISCNEKNKGYSKNFSDALQKANGDIIFLCDQDDIWYDNKIKAMSEIMKKNPNILLLTSNVKALYEGENPEKVNFEKFNFLQKVIHITNKNKWIKPIRPGCSMCFRKSLLDNYVRLWFDEYPHDCLLWGKAVLQGGAYHFNKDTMLFRRHDSNVSSRSLHQVDYRLKLIHTEVDIIKKMIKYQESISQKEIDINQLKKQLDVYIRRFNNLDNKNIVNSIKMIKNIKMYGRMRLWITDIFYCLKNRRDSL